MKNNQSFPSREDLDQAFTILQDQITRISVQEEKEMLKQDMKKE